MKIHARFRLAEDARTSSQQRNEEGQWVMAPAAHVKLGAVTSEPFGNATPSGSMDMVIINPAALQIFREAEIGQEFDVIITPVQKNE
jgi:hypothetical protein